VADLTREEIETFARAWFLALDQHVPIDECYALLADEGLRIVFPDGDIHNHADFKKWYDRVTNLFFDEKHSLHTAEPTAITGDQAEVRIVVGWQASWWIPPAPNSKRVSMDATQDWTVRRSSKNPYGLEIVRYIAQAEPFKYAPGFDRL
jgi:hypothetical protein